MMNAVQYIKNLCESRGMVSYTSPLFTSEDRYTATVPSDCERESSFVRYLGGDMVSVCYHLEMDSRGKFHGYLKEVKIDEAEEMIDALMKRYKQLKKELRHRKIEEL